MKTWIDIILKLLGLSSKESQSINLPEKPLPKPEIDWTNPEAQISKHFKVKEALFLPSWKIYHIPSKSQKKEIIKLAKKMDVLRDKFGPVVVHCWCRPKKVNLPGSIYHGKDYNKAIGGAKSSAHIKGAGIDFHFKGEASAARCAKMRKKLIPWLEPFNLRMENRQGAWIHIDSKPVILHRFFTP